MCVSFANIMYDHTNCFISVILIEFEITLSRDSVIKTQTLQELSKKFFVQHVGWDEQNTTILVLRLLNTSRRLSSNSGVSYKIFAWGLLQMSLQQAQLNTGEQIQSHFGQYLESQNLLVNVVEISAVNVRRVKTISESVNFEFFRFDPQVAETPTLNPTKKPTKNTEHTAFWIWIVVGVGVFMCVVFTIRYILKHRSRRPQTIFDDQQVHKESGLMLRVLGAD